MVLTPTDRGVLETVIDKAIKEAKMNVQTFAPKIVRNSFHIENAEDFAFGMAYGEITATFSSYLTASRRMLPTADELTEVSAIILRRMPEIKNAVSFEE